MGDFTIDISKEGVTKIGNIKYKGEDVDSVGQASCTYDTIFGGQSIKSQLAGMDSPIEERGTLLSKAVVGNNNNVYSKVKFIKVTVKWDGKTESFNLYK
ncbi:hypothetical protein ACQKM9_21560 [Viridibacillus sp. NPDC093762]|uniref:hypothetical protein n=1 Tax=Viridibacillus sp. NPDC093762 TaxID=3390720 RepID=UPI003D068BBD